MPYILVYSLQEEKTLLVVVVVVVGTCTLTAYYILVDFMEILITVIR